MKKKGGGSCELFSFLLAASKLRIKQTKYHNLNLISKNIFYSIDSIIIKAMHLIVELHAPAFLQFFLK